MSRTYSMQYALFQCRLCWIYTAVSVCTAKVIKLSPKNPAAYVYLFLFASFALCAGSRSLNLEDLRRLSAGDCGCS